MKIVEGAGVVLSRAWSVRLTALAIVLSGLETAVAMLDAELLGVAPGRFAALAGIVSIAAMVARVVAQPAMQDEIAEKSDA